MPYVPVIIIAAAVCVCGIVYGVLRSQKNKPRPAVKTTPRPEIRPKTSGEPQTASLSELLDVKRKADVIDSYRPYTALFEQLSMPLRVLFGVAAVLDTEDEEKLARIIRSKVVDGVESVLRRNGIESPDGGFRINETVPPESFYTGYRAQAETWEPGEVAEAVRLSRAIIRDGNIRVTLRKICAELEILKPLIKTQSFDKTLIAETANNARRILETNGVYPMFADDKALAARPDLYDRFIESEPGAFIYPGLFIYENGRLNVFGSCIGSR